MNWELVKIIAVGGLVNVGFVPRSTLIIVASHNGRGIFDCSTGEKTARDNDDIWKFLDDKTGKLKGFDVLDGQKFQTHGLFGGDNLAKNTVDGWHLRKTNQPPFKNNLGENFVLSSPDKTQNTIVGNDNIAETKAFGFSACEQFLVIASSSDLIIYRRKND